MSGRADRNRTPRPGIAESLSDIGFLTAQLWRLDRRTFLLALAETAVSLAQTLAPVAYGIIVAGLVSRSPASVIGGLVWLLLVHGLGVRFAILGTDARLALSDLVRHTYDRRIGELSATLPTVDHLTDPEVLDRLELIVAQQGALGNAANALLNAVRSFVWPAAGLTIALAADWRMVFPALAAIPIAWLATREVRWQRGAEDRSAVHERTTHQLVDATLDPSGGAELRIFSAGGFLTDRLATAATRWRRPFVVAARRSAVASILLTLVYFAVAGVVLVWLTRDALAGTVAVANLTVAITSVGSLRENFTTVRFGVTQVTTLARTVSRYRWFERHASAVLAAHPGATPPPDRLRTGIVLRDVGFTHPGQESPALEGISLSLPAGTTVALVGENGAGKSTLVALLTGLHDPGSGQILVDGTDLAELDPVLWRQRCSGAYQDHLRPEVLADEAIGLGEVTGIDDANLVAAAAREGTATAVVAGLPAAGRTQLGTQWAGGVDLSGGQWQRLALARGMMRQSPLLLVLDEPTAALDPVAEDRLFTRYAAAGRRAGRAGGITVVVTHRFSTVSAADLVVVLHQGRIEQVGTHAELLAAGGRYAELYDLQARGYR